MKKISVLIPCYNEEENVGPMSEALVKMFAEDLPGYDYEIVFIVSYGCYVRERKRLFLWNTLSMVYLLPLTLCREERHVLVAFMMNRVL